VPFAPLEDHQGARFGAVRTHSPSLRPAPAASGRTGDGCRLRRRMPAQIRDSDRHPSSPPTSVAHPQRRRIVGMEPNRADLGRDPSHVSGMFDQVAAGYDRTNTAMTFGNDALWRAATTRAVAPKRGERILDLAAGTASSSASLAGSGAQVVAADFSPGMLAEGRRRHGQLPHHTVGEAEATG